MQDRKAGPRTSAVAMMFAAALVSAHAAAQAPSSRPAPAGAPADFLQAVNETPGTLKLDVFPVGDPAAKGARAHMTACLKPRELVRWPLDPATPIGKIRMQAMSGNGCDGPQQQILCERAIDRAPGLQYVTLRGDGRSCGVFPMPAPAAGPLMAANQPCGPTGHWAPLTIENRDPVRGAWITIYETATDLIGNSKMLASACWKPGETRMACVDRRKLIVRAEMTGFATSRRPEPNCNEQVTCDTGFVDAKRVDMRDGGGATLKMVRDRETGCWWSNYK